MHNLSEEQLTKLYKQYQKADERREEIRLKNELLFEVISKKYGDLSNKFLIVSLVIFIPHCMVCASIFLFDDVQAVNQAIYNALTAVYIPMYRSTGWNLNYISAFIFNLIWIYLHFKKAKEENLLFSNSLEMRFTGFWGFFKLLGARILVLFVMGIFIIVAYASPMLPHSSRCGVRSLCWLQTEDQFYYSVFISYIAFWMINFLIIFSMVCLLGTKKQRNLKYKQFNIDLKYQE
ncbi:7 transmembrane receptor, partial [Rappaport israeli]|uniref:7 transmembrane receptor n=1 Tax=Rappaport israeli TaxID=1839807 RepID=UPI000AA7938A